ncbi:MAG: TetR/AcrR family transcriptional regulator [Actinomycetales bacterium]|nr:TetR/AcrR family transcriptional regulator [Actinomycetales bacterium]
MGRTRSFVESEVVAAARRAFLATGYEGTSVDDLVTATGLHRGSLYGAFGSKRGLFVAALRQALGDATQHCTGPHCTGPAAGGRALDDETLDLVLVALLELAPRDAEVRSLVAGCLAPLTADHEGDSGGDYGGSAGPAANSAAGTPAGKGPATGTDHTPSRTAAQLLGARLLTRAHLPHLAEPTTPTTPETTTPTTPETTTEEAVP